MRRRSWSRPALWAAVVMLVACSGGATTPGDGAVTSVGGGKTGVGEPGAGAGRGGLGRRDGGGSGLGGALGAGRDASSAICASQGGSCQTQPCCGDLHCCSTATSRTCQPACGTGAL